MKKRSILYHRKGYFPAFWIFLAGFLAGVLIPNLIWRLEWHQKTVSSLYLIGTFADKTEEGYGYLAQVFRTRGSFYLLAALCGLSIFGVPLAVASVLVAGVQTGFLLAVSILQFGLQGGIVGASLLFPQYLVYIPCLFYLMAAVYSRSLEIWRSRGFFPGKVSGYVLQVFFCGLAYTAGILLEVLLNPKIVEIVMRNLKIF